MAPLLILAMLLYTAGTESIRTLKHVTVREGGTITIPCLYDNHYKLNPKYWCTGQLWGLCTVKAHTNETRTWLITDDPVHNIFTVQLSNLTSQDSGIHWCGVHIKTGRDHKTRLLLTVQSAPDVSVVPSSVTGEEGGNVSVRCLYSSAYKNKHKQWCRIKEQSCYTVGRSGTSRYSVQISDDGRESFTVLMTGLIQEDTGWYFCSAGDLQVPVQLFVKRNNAFNNTSENDESSDKQPFTNSVCENHSLTRHITGDNKHPSSEHRNGPSVVLWVTAPILLLLVLLLLIWWIKHKHRPDSSVMTEASVSVYYSSVVFMKANEIKEEDHVSIHCSPDQNNDVIYSTVKQLQ